MDQAVEPNEIVAALREYGLTDEELRPVIEHVGHLKALRQIALLLDDSLTLRGVEQWFRACNRLLDGRRPLDALAVGHVEAVLRAAAAFADGAYA